MRLLFAFDVNVVWTVMHDGKRSKALEALVNEHVHRFHLMNYARKAVTCFGIGG